MEECKNCYRNLEIFPQDWGIRCCDCGSSYCKACIYTLGRFVIRLELDKDGNWICDECMVSQDSTTCSCKRCFQMTSMYGGCAAEKDQDIVSDNV